MRNEIVVGLDGSRASADALRWALAEAEVSGDKVVALHAWMPLVVASGLRGVMPAVIEMADESQQLLAEQLAAAGCSEHPSVSVETHAVEAAATATLLERAKGARMLVVGTGQKSRFGRLVLGSTSELCAHEAPCPVVVVPAAVHRADVGAMYTVVVGADGTDTGEAALRFAAEEAQLHDGVVEAYAMVEAAPGDQGLGERMLLRRIARRLDHSAKRARRATGARVMAQAFVGKPGSGLCAAAAAADLLVVGRRSRGALGALVMGSVADHCVRHSTVPVAVIPAEAGS
ncbi:MAG TPA: universal stress protein [Acidimicrobiales bacterium]|nr:universal stress protein [Acidimicrobiales bacterium]